MRGRDLVHFVDQDQRVVHVRLLQAVDQLARHGAHICAAVAFDLRDVIRSAHTELEVLAAQCASNALRDGGLTSTWRTHETKHFSGNVSLQLSHGDELQNTVFHILWFTRIPGCYFQAVVVLIQDLLREQQVHLVFASLVPRETGYPIQVIADG